MHDWVLLCTDIERHDQSGEFRELILFFIIKFSPNLGLNFMRFLIFLGYFFLDKF